jgi:hypothetical protein
MLSSVTYTPDVDLHDYKNDVTDERTGTNWVAGGVTLASCTVTVIGASNRVKFSAADVAQGNVTLTGARVLVIYDSTPGTDATRPIIGSVVFDGDLSPSGATLSIDFDDTNGIWYATY